jgi:hypothetical protein
LRSQRFHPKTLTVILALLVMLLGVRPAVAMDQATIEDVQAAMRTLNFLESLPREGPIVVGVIYPSDIPTAQAVAEVTAQLMGTMRGPNARSLQPIVISTNALGRFEAHLDVLFLMVGASKHSALILDTVSAGPRVEVSLNAALADAVGARFSLIFTMVVKRK